MNERKSKNIVIIALCITLIFMGVGFSLLSQTLNINGTTTVTGTWDVRITGIEATEAMLEGEAVTDLTTLTAAGTVNTDGTLAEFNVTLPNPEDYVVYKVTVTNAGTIDAALTSLTTALGEDSTDYDYIDYEVTHVEGEENKALDANGGTHTFTVKATYDKDFVGANRPGTGETPAIPEGGATEKIVVTMQYEQAA